MGLFDNWSWGNVAKNLNPMDSTLGSFYKGDMGKVGQDLVGAARGAVDFGQALQGAALNPVGTYNQTKGNLPNLDVYDRARQGMEGATAQMQQDRERAEQGQRNQALAEQQAQAKAKADKDALLRGSGFLQALQSQEPGMFRKKQRGRSEWGSPMGGL